MSLDMSENETFAGIDREIYQVLGLLNRLIESLRTRPAPNPETLKP